MGRSRISARTPDAESTRTRPGPRVRNTRGVKASALGWASVRECHPTTVSGLKFAAQSWDGFCGTMNVVDASRIARFPNFADLPADELDELAAAMREVDVEAGATVITLDDYGTAIYFIEEGTADVLDDGDETNQPLGPGDTFGEIGLLLTGQRTATVVALTSMRLLSLSGQDFDRIRARVPEVEGSLRRLGIGRASR